MGKIYTEHEGKVVSADGRFKHVMAIALDPRTGYKNGIIRCITSRTGDVEVKGYVDRSELHKIHGDSFEHFEIGERLNIKNEEKIISQLIDKGGDFIGLEDPDIWIDAKTNLMHVYFTIPIIFKEKNKKTKTHLGHAVGADLDSLEMTMPVLIGTYDMGAKEVSIAPENSIGVINGREANRKVGAETKYGIFSVSLFIYDYENGKIDWVSSEPLIRDSEAKTITFASQFVETSKGEGILYAHVDDSFVRAYTLKAELLKSILPRKYIL